DKLLNIKCFVQPPQVAAARSAHYFNLRHESRYVAFTEHGVGLPPFPRRYPNKLTTDFIRYNHYFTRSKADFEGKVTGPYGRGVRYTNPTEYRRNLGRFLDEHGQP